MMLGARLTHGQPGSLRLVGAPVWAIRWPSGVIRPSDVRVALAPDRPAGPFAALHSIQPANRPEDPPTGLANRRRATVSAVAQSRHRSRCRAIGRAVALASLPRPGEQSSMSPLELRRPVSMLSVAEWTRIPPDQDTPPVICRPCRQIAVFTALDPHIEP